MCLVHQKDGDDPHFSGVRMRPKEKRKTGEQPVIGWQLDLVAPAKSRLILQNGFFRGDQLGATECLQISSTWFFEAEKSKFGYIGIVNI